MTTVYDTFANASIPAWPETSVQRGIFSIWLLSWMDDNSITLENIHYNLTDSQMLDFMDVALPDDELLFQDFDYPSAPAGVVTLIADIRAYREKLRINTSMEQSAGLAQYAGGDTMFLGNLNNITAESDLMLQFIISYGVLSASFFGTFDDAPLVTLQRILDRPVDEKLSLFLDFIMRRDYDYVDKSALYDLLIPNIHTWINELEGQTTIPQTASY